MLGAEAGRPRPRRSTIWAWRSPTNAIELFADLPPDHPFFQQLAFMTPEEIPVYQNLLQKLKGKSYEASATTIAP